MRLSLKETAMAAVFGLLSMGVTLVRASVVNIPASADATLLGGTDATTNQSLANPGIFVGTDGQGNPKRGLIQFNIAGAVPAGATITGVQLQLTVGQVAGSGGGSGGSSGPQTISLFDETRTWGQPTNVVGAVGFGGHGHGAPPQNGDATWNDAFYNSNSSLATPWTAAGGNWTSGSTDIADASVTATLATFTWSSAAMIADMQKWLDKPSSNFGWLIKNADEIHPTNFRAFWSAQGTNSNNPTAIAPNLSVTFVPEPLGFSLVAVGAPLLLCRRQWGTPRCSSRHRAGLR